MQTKPNNSKRNFKYSKESFRKRILGARSHARTHTHRIHIQMKWLVETEWRESCVAFRKSTMNIEILSHDNILLVIAVPYVNTQIHIVFHQPLQRHEKREEKNWKKKTHICWNCSEMQRNFTKNLRVRVCKTNTNTRTYYPYSGATMENWKLFYLWTLIKITFSFNVLHGNRIVRRWSNKLRVRGERQQQKKNKKKRNIFLHSIQEFRWNFHSVSNVTYLENASCSHGEPSL